ncbi:hypothetical protein AVEN_233226-1 [Araneus ventricosus]|uniref:Uncharacterized protein n=1 Tax=Araneus ventricosus TaxID=182803 RepID=A0A4Y2EMA4_ARAVE|nr:hypothetical protein AVEN_233226-1 [Araneus ventricosus]
MTRTTPERGPQSPSFRTMPARGSLTHVGFNVDLTLKTIRLKCTADLEWKRALSLEPMTAKLRPYQSYPLSYPNLFFPRVRLD